jgi:methionyl-tRNA formyltransferase
LVTLFCLGKKALTSLSQLSQEYCELVESVVVGKDPNVQHDYSEEIRGVCNDRGLKVYAREDVALRSGNYSIAIGWRWLIDLNEAQTLIVFHDSLLPRNRGFNPLVTALINGDPEIGVTALLGQKEFDKGDIIAVQRMTVTHPIRIEQAIDLVSKGYAILLAQVFEMISKRSLKAVPQNETEATYSLWRDDEDYYIDWSWSSDRIQRFIYAVGFPYQGARTKLDGEDFIVADAIPVPDVFVENRFPGKVLFRQDGRPVVVCGKGLLKIESIIRRSDNSTDFPSRFRIRLK